jgi:hypothetical protein
MDPTDKRIHQILGEDRYRNGDNAERYRAYLLEHLSFPIQVTGLEDFPWEEPYVLGVWDRAEYEELKKVRPSYTDTFDLNGLEPPDDRDDITAHIRRVSDGQRFEIGLSWLKAQNPKDPFAQLLEDYGIWHTNY